MNRFFLRLLLTAAFFGGTLACAGAEEFADPVCTAATPVGKQLDRNLHETPVSPVTVNKTEAQLADVYATCGSEYRMSGNVEARFWAAFREAKLRLLLGDYELQAQHVNAARSSYQTAFDLSDEIAKYEGGGLQVTGNNHVGSYSSDHTSTQFSQFKDLATQLRDIAKKSLADLPKP